VDVPEVCEPRNDDECSVVLVLNSFFYFKFPVSLSSLLHAARVFSSTTHARVDIVIYVIMSSYTKYDDQS